MKTSLRLLAGSSLLFVVVLARGEETLAKSPTELLSGAIQRIVTLVEPVPGTDAATFSTRLHFLKAEGLPKDLMGQNAELALQAPDRLSLTAHYKNKTYAAGRNGQEL